MAEQRLRRAKNALEMYKATLSLMESMPDSCLCKQQSSGTYSADVVFVTGLDLPRTSVCNDRFQTC